MVVYTDNIEYARKIISEKENSLFSPVVSLDEGTTELCNRLFLRKKIWQTFINEKTEWDQLFLVKYAQNSQFDILVQLHKEKYPLLPLVLCVAESGEGFHGFHNREWNAVPGNLHISAFISPEKTIRQFEIGFLIIAALSVLNAVESFSEFSKRVGIKWLNDIFLDEAKICGVLAHTFSEGQNVTAAILGIGLNVEITPEIPATPFVPFSGSLRQFSKHPETIHQQEIFWKIMKSLYVNYQRLIQDGLSDLVNEYRKKSIVVGREIILCEDSWNGNKEGVYAQGVVRAIGEKLELFLEGNEQPYVKGRLIMRPRA